MKAAAEDRELLATDGRLGETILTGGIARYYDAPFASGDRAFDRAQHLRQPAY